MKPRNFPVLISTALFSAVIIYIVCFKRSDNAVYICEPINVALPEPILNHLTSREFQELTFDVENCNLEYVNSQKVAPDDACLLYIIRTQFLHPPTLKPLNLDYPTKTYHSQGREDEIIATIVRNQTGGVFVEAGVFDGEIYSNTLYFERFLNWRGILIEPSPKQLATLFTKNRNAWIVAAGISPNNYPMKLPFHDNYEYAKIVEKDEILRNEEAPVRELQFFPFYSILLALRMENTPIDFFSLDVEGAELSILRTIPWDKVNIKTLAVEFKHDKEPPTTMKSYMEQQQYRTAWIIEEPVQDFVFVKKD